MPNEIHYQEEPMNRAVRLVSEDDVFKSMTYAAMKIKAGKLKPGEIVVIGNHEFTVAEDDEGTGITVQMILSRQFIESLAEVKASSAGLDLKDLDDRTHSERMEQFLSMLKETLRKWHETEMRSGPGDNLTFIRMVYKWSYGNWK